MPTISRAHALRLKPGTIDRFRSLTTADQRHLLQVHALRCSGEHASDLAFAGLLHDIGKTGIEHPVRLLDGCLWVMVKRFMPRFAIYLCAQSQLPGIGAEFWSVANHARFGASITRELGYSERICWLIEHCELDAIDDEELQRLHAAYSSQSTVSRAPFRLSAAGTIRKDAHVSHVSHQ